MTPQTITLHEASPIRTVGFIGFGFVGRATAHALQGVVEVVHHDPAMPGSRPLEELVHRADALFVCLPTPMASDGSADVSIVHGVLDRLALSDPSGLVIIKSTVPPGSTMAWAEAFPSLSLVFSPEFLRERHHLDDAVSPARTVLGWTNNVSDVDRHTLLALTRTAFPRTPIIELDATSAELLKYASNAIFGVKVSLANELAELGTALGLDWEPVRRALVLDPRIGGDHLSVPGPDGILGFGGSCLPKDMFALASAAADVGVALPVVVAAVDSNQERRAHDATRAALATGRTCTELEDDPVYMQPYGEGGCG